MGTTSQNIFGLVNKLCEIGLPMEVFLIMINIVLFSSDGLLLEQPETNIESPTTRAALFYLESTLGKEEESCAKVAKVYIETLLAGGSPAQANAEAAAVFIRNYNEGSRHMPGSPCEAADNAFRDAAESGEDPVLAAAQAFMQSYKSDSPCSVAAKDYMQTVGKGFSPANAYLSAAKSFGRQIQTLASQGKTTIDPICAEAALSYTSATS